MAWPVAPHAPHSRRTLLAQGLRGGILLAASPAFLETAVNPSSRLTRWAIPTYQASTATLVLATNRAPSDLDPHSAYDPGSQIALGGLFEGLIQIQTGTADTIDPVLAESWTANADKSVWTFFLRPDVTFQDGTPLDAEAARASFERLLTLGLAPSTVLGRFIDDSARITAPDSRTLVFDLGKPQPMFEAAIASPVGGTVVNASRLRAHEVDGDWGHGWAQTNSDGVGTGPYRLASFDPEEGVVLERYPEYWRGWAGEHFSDVAIRVVTEPETRRVLLETGEADIATTMPLTTTRTLEANRELRVDRRFTLAVSYVAMTVAGPLRSPEARQALCWAFPYDDVIDGIFEGFAKRAVGPVAELCQGFNPDTFVYSTDLDRARALLQRAGVAEGTTISYALPVGNREATAIAELFAANLAALGLNPTSRSSTSRRTSTSPSGISPRSSVQTSFPFSGRRTTTTPGITCGPKFPARPGRRAMLASTATRASKTCWRRRNPLRTRRAIWRRWQRSSKLSRATIRPRSTSPRLSGQP